MTPIVRFFGRVLFFGGVAAALVGVLDSVFSSNTTEASTAMTVIVASVNAIGLGGILVVLILSRYGYPHHSALKNHRSGLKAHTIARGLIAFMEHRKACSWCQRGQMKCPTGKAIAEGKAT